MMNWILCLGVNITLPFCKAFVFKQRKPSNIVGTTLQSPYENVMKRSSEVLMWNHAIRFLLQASRLFNFGTHMNIVRMRHPVSTLAVRHR